MASGYAPSEVSSASFGKMLEAEEAIAVATLNAAKVRQKAVQAQNAIDILVADLEAKTLVANLEVAKAASSSRRSLGSQLSQLPDFHMPANLDLQGTGILIDDEPFNPDEIWLQEIAGDPGQDVSDLLAQEGQFLPAFPVPEDYTQADVQLLFNQPVLEQFDANPFSEVAPWSQDDIASIHEQLELEAEVTAVASLWALPVPMPVPFQVPALAVEVEPAVFPANAIWPCPVIFSQPANAVFGPPVSFFPTAAVQFDIATAAPSEQGFVTPVSNKSLEELQLQMEQRLQQQADDMRKQAALMQAKFDEQLCAQRAFFDDKLKQERTAILQHAEQSIAAVNEQLLTVQSQAQQHMQQVDVQAQATLKAQQQSAHAELQHRQQEHDTQRRWQRTAAQEALRRQTTIAEHEAAKTRQMQQQLAQMSTSMP
ncbi:unnamed protein product, partial [Polarella glacialis]